MVFALPADIGVIQHQNGHAWLGQADMHRLTEDEKQRIRAKLNEAEKRATALLEPYKEQLSALAERLVETRELEGETLHHLLADLSAVISPVPGQTGPAFEPLAKDAKLQPDLCGADHPK